MERCPGLPATSTSPSPGEAEARLLRSTLLLVGGSLALVILWPYRHTLWALLQDPQALRTWVQGLGWWGPLALIGVNIIQIVFAPLPGYGVFVAAGYLFGWFWGGVWGTLGMLLGAMAAMAVARHVGRPFVERMVGRERLARWEEATRSDSTLVWTLILLSPIGDAPYLLAGLSRVSYTKILVLILITRAPAAFAASAMGAGAFSLTAWQILLIAGVLAAPVLLFTRFQSRVEAWLRERALRQSRSFRENDH